MDCEYREKCKGWEKDLEWPDNCGNHGEGCFTRFYEEHQTAEAEPSRTNDGLCVIVPKRDAVIVEFVGDRFVISIECHDSTNEDLLQQMARDIMDITT